MRVRGRRAEGSGDWRALKARARSQMARFYVPVLVCVMSFDFLLFLFWSVARPLYFSRSILGLEAEATGVEWGWGTHCGAPTCWSRGSKGGDPVF